MKKTTILAHEFVKSIPAKLEKWTLYVSMDFATVVHECCCGCGREVVTPLSPTDWKLTYDGVSISLSPSIGNWNFDCQSHYWIVNNVVKWGKHWSKEEIEAGRTQDRLAKKRYYATDGTMGVEKVARGKVRKGILARLLKWWRQ